MNLFKVTSLGYFTIARENELTLLCHVALVTWERVVRATLTVVAASVPEIGIR